MGPGRVRLRDVLVADTDRPVLVDFSLARRLTATYPRMSIVGGTPMYMAPEQSTDADGSRASPRSDIYGLACTAYELLTGRAVFDGETAFDVMLAHLQEEPPEPSRTDPELAPFDAVFERALAKDPALRFSSCADFSVALQHALDVWEIASRTPHVTVVAANEDARRLLGRVARGQFGTRDPEVRVTASLEPDAVLEPGAALVILDADCVPSLPEAIAAVRRACGRSTRIVVAAPPGRDSCRDAADAVLAKPFNVCTAAAAMRRALGPHGTSARTPIR